MLAQGEPWIGYRQFCELFLYPLMLQAYKGVDFRPWLRGNIDGIPAEAMRPLLSARDYLRGPACCCTSWRRARCSGAIPAGSKCAARSPQAGFDKA